MKVTFSKQAIEDYHYWISNSLSTYKKIKRLLDDIMRNGYSGIGHPKALTGDLAGWWSRRIDETNRLVYRIYDNVIEIKGCKGHYDDK